MIDLSLSYSLSLLFYVFLLFDLKCVVFFHSLYSYINVFTFLGKTCIVCIGQIQLTDPIVHLPSEALSDFNSIFCSLVTLLTSNLETLLSKYI